MRNFILSWVLILFFTGCRSTGSSLQEKPVISVSILPERYFVERIAGDLVTVNVMIPSGASPATYEPTVAQLGNLDRSDLYLKVGYLGFELSWMEKIMSQNPSMKVVDLSTGIELIREEHHSGRIQSEERVHPGTDPHIWMSVRNARMISNTIAQALKEILPGKEDILASNLSGLIKDLDSLDRVISRMMDGLENRCFMIYHPALSYFARDYNLKQVALEMEGKTPSPAHMKQMVDLGRQEKISVIFLQSQFDSKNASVLAAEIGAEIVRIDPLDPDWKDQMLYIAVRLKESL
jgi:zinc transport system substrate-binding protein